jgi:hypothetical protein
MSELEKRKRQLVLESEVYRETLRLELHTFVIYGRQTARRIRDARTYFSLLLRVLSAARFLFSAKPKQKEQSSFGRFGRMAWMGWRAYQRFGPAVRSFFTRRAARQD